MESREGRIEPFLANFRGTRPGTIPEEDVETQGVAVIPSRVDPKSKSPR